MQIVPLESMRNGETAHISDVEGTHDLVHRLDEMGLRVGTELRMIRQGSPCIIALGDQRLTFRTPDDLHILVEVMSN